jgi:hypothetical protein
MKGVKSAWKLLGGSECTQAMKRINLAELTVAQLVERFTEIARAQHRATLMFQIAKYNRLFDQMSDVMAALKVRSGDQRRALIPLFSHPNAQVRFTAAVATMRLDREGARRVLELIRERNEYPQAADARSILQSLDEGKLPYQA